jgi:hypothetical protein
MAEIKATCRMCGCKLPTNAADAFAGAAVVGLCPSCADSQVGADGGIVLVLRRPIDGARFRVSGKVVVTARAVAALAGAGMHALDLVARHARGDFGR